MKEQAQNNLVFIASIASIIVFFIPQYVNYFLLNPFFIIIALLISRLLAGFGIFSIFLNLSISIMQFYAPKIKRRKEEAYKLKQKLVQLGYVYAIALLGYYIITLASPSKGVDIFFLLAGLITIMLTVYIIPIWQEAKEIKGRQSFSEIILEKANQVTLGFKKIYYDKLVRDYGKAIALEFMKIKIKMDRMRLKIAKYSFLFIAFSITPILPVSIPTWYKYIKTYVLKTESFNYSTKMVFVLSILSLIAYVVSVILYEHIIVQSVVWQLPYIVGSLTALYVYHTNIR